MLGDVPSRLPGADSDQDSPWEQRPVLRGSVTIGGSTAERERRDFLSDQDVLAARFGDGQFALPPAPPGAVSVGQVQDRYFVVDTCGFQTQLHAGEPGPGPPRPASIRSCSPGPELPITCAQPSPGAGPAPRAGAPSARTGQRPPA